jgi:hypothetical protein
MLVSNAKLKKNSKSLNTAMLQDFSTVDSDDVRHDKS